MAPRPYLHTWVVDQAVAVDGPYEITYFWPHPALLLQHDAPRPALKAQQALKQGHVQVVASEGERGGGDGWSWFVGLLIGRLPACRWVSAARAWS